MNTTPVEPKELIKLTLSVSGLEKLDAMLLNESLAGRETDRSRFIEDLIAKEYGLQIMGVVKIERLPGPPLIYVQERQE